MTSDATDSGPASADRPAGDPRAVPGGEDGLLAALHVKRNVAIAFVVGVGFAGLLYGGRVLEVLGPAPSRGSPALFLALAIVLATTVTALVAIVLTAVSAYRLVRRSSAARDEDRLDR